VSGVFLSLSAVGEAKGGVKGKDASGVRRNQTGMRDQAAISITDLDGSATKKAKGDMYGERAARKRPIEIARACLASELGVESLKI